jgi:hypothetical protein
MANGAIVCKNPPIYPMLTKIQAAEAENTQITGKLCKQAPEPTTPDLTELQGRDCGPRPLPKGKCPPINLTPIDCGPFPGPMNPRIDGPRPVNIRDEIMKTIQICPTRGPNGEAVFPSKEAIDRMIDDIIKHRTMGGDTPAVRGHHSEIHGKPVQHGGCKGHLVEVEHARQGHAIGHALQGHAVGESHAQMGIGQALSSEAHAHRVEGHATFGESHSQTLYAQPTGRGGLEPMAEALHSQTLHARPTGRGGLEPMGEPMNAKPLDGSFKVPAPRGDGYYLYQQEKMKQMAQELSRPLDSTNK